MTRLGSNHVPIPPDLVKRLGPSERFIGGENCWSLGLVAWVIGCTRTTLQNWINRGQLPRCHYDAGRWWFPESTLKQLAHVGPAAADRYPRLMGRRFKHADKTPPATPDANVSTGEGGAAV
jgi:hypothetical protein